LPSFWLGFDSLDDLVFAPVVPNWNTIPKMKEAETKKRGNEVAGSKEDMKTLLVTGTTR